MPRNNGYDRDAVLCSLGLPACCWLQPQPEGAPGLPLVERKVYPSLGGPEYEIDWMATDSVLWAVAWAGTQEGEDISRGGIGAGSSGPGQFSKKSRVRRLLLQDCFGEVDREGQSRRKIRDGRFEKERPGADETAVCWAWLERVGRSVRHLVLDASPLLEIADPTGDKRSVTDLFAGGDEDAGAGLKTLCLNLVDTGCGIAAQRWCGVPSLGLCVLHLEQSGDSSPTEFACFLRTLQPSANLVLGNGNICLSPSSFHVLLGWAGGRCGQRIPDVHVEQRGAEHDGGCGVDKNPCEEDSSAETLWNQLNDIAKKVEQGDPETISEEFGYVTLVDMGRPSPKNPEFGDFLGRSPAEERRARWSLWGW